MSVRQRLIKLALSRVAKEFIQGSLSPKGMSDARKFLPGTERLTDGLNRGSHAIADKLGVTIHQMHANPLVNFARALREPPKGFMTPGNIGERVVNAALSSGSHATGKKINIQPGQITRGARGISATDRAHADAITLRHEAMEQLTQPKRRLFNGPKAWGGSRGALPLGLAENDVRARTGLHNAPQVLIDESRNVSLASPKLREHWQKLRVYGVAGKEAEQLRHGGVEYGLRTPVRKKDVARASARILEKDPMRGMQMINPVQGVSQRMANHPRPQDVHDMLRENRDALVSRVKAAPSEALSSAKQAFRGWQLRRQQPNLTPQEARFLANQ